MSETVQADTAEAGAVAGAALRYGTAYKLHMRDGYLSWARGADPLKWYAALDVEPSRIVFLDENGGSPDREVRSGDTVVVQLQGTPNTYLIYVDNIVNPRSFMWDLWGIGDPQASKKFVIADDGSGPIKGAFRLGWSGDRENASLKRDGRWVVPGPRGDGIWWTAE